MKMEKRRGGSAALDNEKEGNVTLGLESSYLDFGPKKITIKLPL